MIDGRGCRPAHGRRLAGAQKLAQTFFPSPLDSPHKGGYSVSMSTNRIAKIEDHEGHGFCGTCKRDNLRWIVTFADGTQSGTECAKRVLGYAIAPKSYKWMDGFAVIAEHATKHETAVLYRNEKGRTALAINGVLYVMGGGAREFDRLFGANS